MVQEGIPIAVPNIMMVLINSFTFFYSESFPPRRKPETPIIIIFWQSGSLVQRLRPEVFRCIAGSKMGIEKKTEIKFDN